MTATISIVRPVALNATQINVFDDSDPYAMITETIVTSLVWDPSDPSTVTMTMTAHSTGEPLAAEMKLSRGLLNAGMTRPVLADGLSVEPDKLFPDRWTVITVDPLGKDPCPNPVPTVEIERFLWDTYALAPLSEKQSPDWDELPLW